MTRTGLYLLLVGLMFSWGCAHSLEAKYGTGDALGYSVTRESLQNRVVLGVKAPAVKDKYDESLYHGIVEALDRTGSFSAIVKNYSDGQSLAGQTPDVVLDIQISSTYDDNEAQNWATQWPGVIVFSTWWNGLLYHDDIDTKVTAKLAKTGQVAEVKSHDQYHIHYASNVRGVFAGSIVGWFLLTIPSFICAAIPTDWDDNMKADAVMRIREEYGRIIAQKTIEAFKKENLLAQSESQIAQAVKSSKQRQLPAEKTLIDN